MSKLSNIDRAAHDPLRQLALLATGSTGADIERVVREARGHARRQRRSVVWADIEMALTSSARPPHDALDWQIAVHEMGHAIAYVVLGIGTVTTVRIGGPGGLVSIDLDVAAVQDDDGVVRMAAAILAGRVAEQMVLGRIGIGAGGNVESDLAKATQLATEAETSLGLGTEMALLYRPPSNVYDILHYNPTLARRVNARLEAAEVIARDILERHRGVLTALAGRLRQARVMEGVEVVAALAKATIDPIASENAIPKSG
jgi:ATP-dependent Zn protease